MSLYTRHFQNLNFRKDITMGKDLYIGIDVGSTTIKLVVMDENTNIIESSYNRHFSDTKRSIYNCLKELITK